MAEALCDREHDQRSVFIQGESARFSLLLQHLAKIKKKGGLIEYGNRLRSGRSERKSGLIDKRVHGF